MIFFLRDARLDIMSRWFLDLGLEEPSFAASTFCKNRERLASEEVAVRFFDAVARVPMPAAIGTSRASGALQSKKKRHDCGCLLS